MNADEKVAAWALDKYKQKYRYYDNLDYYHKFNHLKECATTKATPITFEWLCGCYSEYTRDDSFWTSFTISCDCLVEDVLSIMSSEWDLPEILRELDEYESTQECDYWEEED